MVRWLEVWRARTTLKEELNSFLIIPLSTGIEPHTTGTPSKGHMVPLGLGLVPGLRTKALRWRHQEVHHCASAVAI